MIDLMRFCLTNDVWMRMENEKQTNTNNDDEKNKPISLSNGLW